MARLFNRSIQGLACAVIGVVVSTAAQDGTQFANREEWVSPVYVGADANGEYLAYNVVDYSRKHWTAVLYAIRSKEKTEWPESRAVGFLDKSGVLVLEGPGDGLRFVGLAGKSVSLVPHSSGAKIAVAGGRQWLLYRVSGSDQTLVARDDQGAEERFQHVINYTVGPTSAELLLHTDKEEGLQRQTCLVWADLRSRAQVTLWSVSHAQEVQVREPKEIWDRASDAIAFAPDIVAGGSHSAAIWYFKEGMLAPECLVDGTRSGVSGDMNLPGADDLHLAFAADGKLLCFTLASKSEPPLEKPKMASVDVWSYRDPMVQSMQRDPFWSSKALQPQVAALCLADRRIFRISATLTDDVLSDSIRETATVIARGRGGDEREWKWNPAGRFDVILRSLPSGTEHVLKRDLARWFAQHYSVSPDGRYVVYYNPETRNWFVRGIITGKERDLTGRCGVEWTNYYLGNQFEPTDAIAGDPLWIENGNSFLLYSRNDIWLIDLERGTEPINLTRQCTSRKNVVFRLADGPPGSGPQHPASSIIAHAFDRDTKDEGFLGLDLREDRRAGQVKFLPAALSLASTPDHSATDSGFVVNVSTATESPNLWFTKNFETYVPVSDVHPERNYPRLTADLYTWVSLSGRETQGVLYKPSDFDPTKRYPVLLHYYQSVSDGLNNFIPPYSSRENSGELYPPYLTARGYLVFEIDILPGMPGETGKTAFDAVVSAAQMLATKPWIDAKHMGLRGQSFGAYETNYIVAHTHLFAAAVATSGWADFISAYNGIRFPGDGATRAYAYERGRERMGATLWEKPTEYIENSPVFLADKVTTPLLLMNNSADADVNWWQGLEWFNALRRLGKKAWMLQYDGQGHSLGDPTAIKDFDQRMMQFYDHYLKSAPPPEWMTSGIPARRKGYEDGLDLDTSGRQP